MCSSCSLCDFGVRGRQHLLKKREAFKRCPSKFISKNDRHTTALAKGISHATKIVSANGHGVSGVLDCFLVQQRADKGPLASLPDAQGNLRLPFEATWHRVDHKETG